MSVEVHHVAEGPPQAPLLVLSGSLGSTLEMWRPQVEALSDRFRIVRYDIRGHGRSPVPPGPYSLADLGGDVLRLLDRLGAERAHFAGLSLGGMTGMWLAAHAPERIDRLALLCTAPKMPPEAWRQRAQTVREQGVGAVADGVVERWFTPGYAEREPEVVAMMRRMVAGVSAEGYAGCCTAIEHMDLRPDLARITAPTLVVAGGEDPATPPADAERIAAAVPDARLHVLDGGAHLASWERAEEVDGLLRTHFGGAAPTGGARPASKESR
ncbi:3-oxoadipate enol-lactonase [Streptomonospora litoralis]|uniref:3-oxoadipate enol-lactonase 2 n=1 Tax=Streptomonospora litoralis TaxID=2498135 RepID=A0A4P6PYX4_9ACTN|nr:3-oxoadipate enol-lactonase [Streptomonospora litoralis]QBI53375.1 3-oxoadipate enol-lactonase 2 [Streptomonospora litoralis]